MTSEKDPRDVMQAEHDARLSEHPAFRAPAEMPGVEEIHELLLKTQRSFQAERDAKLAGQGLWPDRSPAPLNVLAKAILALFAPILAEMREIANAQGQQRFANLLRADAAEARALAAEAALEKAVVFDLGNHQTIESRGDGRWAIKDAGCVLNADGVWEYEPNPSNRTDDFIARTRFDRDDAFRRAAAIRAQGARLLTDDARNRTPLEGG